MKPFAPSLCGLMSLCLVLGGRPAAAQDTPNTFWGGETDEARALTAQYAAKAGTEGHAGHAMIAACHKRSVDIGLAILKRGGSAADAFIAVTFADYVQTPGASSLGGPLGVLVYTRSGSRLDSLTAPLKMVEDPAGLYRAGDTALGKEVLVPGALAGLEALHKKYGRLPWRDLVMPAAELARDGFPVDPLYAGILAAYARVPKHSAYGRATYFHPDGTPLASGEILKLPVLAATLQAIADHGSAVLYHGALGRQMVDAVTAEGGAMTLKDLADYRPEWSPPLHIRYRDSDLYALNGHNSGGERLLLAMKTLAHTDIKALGHYSQSLDGLETMVRISRAVQTVPQLSDQTFYDDPSHGQALLDGHTDDGLWADVAGKIDRTPAPPKGSHSYAVVVVDADGNAVAGTHTIESLPWGSGLFAGGIPLNNTAILHPFVPGSPVTTPAGAYIIEPLSAAMAFRNGALVLADSTFSASLWPADFELTTSALDFGWTPERIALTPRFGTYSIDLARLTADPSSTAIDKRYSAEVIARMQKRGLTLSQAGYIDTGMLVMIERDPATGALSGFTPEQLPDGKAEGY